MRHFYHHSYFYYHDSYDRPFQVIALITATAYAAGNDDDYLLKLIHASDNEKHGDIFHMMHDQNHRHPRHRGTHIC